MRFIDIETGDGYVALTSDDGIKYILPSSSIIVVDDESGAIAVKNTASRCTIGYILK